MKTMKEREKEIVEIIRKMTLEERSIELFSHFDSMTDEELDQYYKRFVK